MGDRFGVTGRDAKQAWDGIKNAFKLTMAVIVPVFEHFLLPAAKRTFSGIVHVARGMARIVGGVVKVLAGVLTLDFGKAWEGIKQIFSGATEYLVGIFGAVTAPARSALEGIWTGLSAGARAAFDAVKSVIVGILNSLIQAYQDTLGKVPGALDIGLIDGGSGGDDVNPYGRSAGRRLRNRLSPGGQRFAGALGLTSPAGATTLSFPMQIKVQTGDRALGEAVGRHELKAGRFG